MKQLKIKDIIFTGVYAALYFICVGLGTLIGAIIVPSANMMMAPVVTALISGSVYMLLIAKVKKMGAVTLVGVVMGMFFLLSGHYALSFLPSFLCGVLADVIASKGNYENATYNTVSYIVFSYGNLGPIILMWVAKDAYMQRLLDKGKSMAYIQDVMIEWNVGNVLFFVVSIFIMGLIGAIFGRHIVQKHFEKSGIV